MKKQFKTIFLINSILIAAGTIICLISDGPDHFITLVGVIMLLFFALNLGLGILFLLIGIGEKKLVPYGLGMLLVAGISLLCSFTFCSIEPMRFN